MDSSNSLNITLRSSGTPATENQLSDQLTDHSSDNFITRTVASIYPSLPPVRGQTGNDDALSSEQDLPRHITDHSPDSMHDRSTSTVEDQKMNKARMIEVAEGVFREMEASADRSREGRLPDTTSDHELARVLKDLRLQSPEEENPPGALTDAPLDSRSSNQPPPNISSCSGSIRGTINGIYYSGCYHNGIWVPDPSENDDPFRNLEYLGLLPPALTAIFNTDYQANNEPAPVTAEEFARFIDILSHIPSNYKNIFLKKYLDAFSYTITLDQLPSIIEGVNGGDVAKILQTLKPRWVAAKSTGSSRDQLVITILAKVPDSDKAAIIESLLSPETDKLAVSTFLTIISAVSDSFKANLIRALKPYLVTVPLDQLAVQLVNSCSDSFKVEVINSLLKISQQSVTPDDLFQIVSHASDGYKVKIISALNPYLSTSLSHQLFTEIVNQCSHSYRDKVRDSLPLLRTEAQTKSGGLQPIPTDQPPSYEESVSASAGSSAGSSAAFPVNSFDPFQLDDDWVLDCLRATSDFYKVVTFKSVVDSNTKVSGLFLQKVVSETTDFYKADIITAIKPHLSHKLTPQEISKISMLSSGFYKADVLRALTY